MRRFQSLQRFTVVDLQWSGAQHLQRGAGNVSIRFHISNTRLGQRFQHAGHTGRIGIEIQLHANHKGRTLIRLAAEGNFPPHLPHQLLGDDQTQPGAAMTPRNAGVSLTKRLEQLCLLLLRDTDTAILNLNLQLDARLGNHPLSDAQADVSFLSKLDGVTNQVDQNLLQSQRIANHVVRHAAVTHHRQLQPLFMRRRRQQHQGFIQRGAQREGDRLQHQLARFQLRKIEHVVDNTEQIIG